MICARYNLKDNFEPPQDIWEENNLPNYVGTVQILHNLHNTLMNSEYRDYSLS